MSHKTNKNKNEFRGPTFVGFRPIIEEGKKGRKEKQYKKHKNKRFEIDD